MKFGLSFEEYNQIFKIIKKYDKYIFKIFGSRATGKYKENSDIDIAVLNCFSEEDKFNIKDEFDNLIIPHTIDLIFVCDITKIEFLKSIENEGVEII